MQRKYLFILILFIFISCGKFSFRKKSSFIIPKDKLIPILVDLHLSDAVLNSPNIKSLYNKQYAEVYYDQVFELHGYTRAQFDTTIKFYSVKPSKLENIYDDVIEELSKLESSKITSEFFREKPEAVSASNLWNLEYNWSLPENGEVNPINFSIPVSELGTYTISARIKMYEDDESKNPRVSAFFWYDDGSEYGYRVLFPSSPILKNNEFVIHSISKQLTNSKVTHLRGWILDHSAQDITWKKHAEVQNIKVEYKPVQAPKIIQTR